MTVLRRRLLATLTALAVALPVLGALTAPAAGAAGEDVLAWLEVEDGVISGGAAGLPGFNSGDHSNFSGSGSYTFRETGMASTMTVVAPAAGTYPVHVRYAAGPLGVEENVTRSMGLLTNGGSRQQLSLPMTSFENWEAWRFVTTSVALQQGTNTIALQCDRSTDFCRLNFDAVQVGGTTPDPCAGTPVQPGWTGLFDGTLASFDGWRKAGAGGFGRQTDCTIRSFRGRGAQWHTVSQTAPYTLELDWRREATNDDSAVLLASTSRAGADPVGGYRIPIGVDTGSILPTGGTAQTPNRTALAAALHPVGEWNTYTIQLTPTRLRLSLNGTLINTLERPTGAPVGGYVGLENRSSTDQVDFRDIAVLPDVELGQLTGPAVRASLADGTTVNPGGESTLGNLVAEAQRWATRTPSYGGAQLAFTSPTSLGADLTAATYQQAAAVQPAADTLVNLRLTGAQVRTALEQQWQRTSGGTVPTPAFLRLGTSAGLRYTFDPARAEGSRITGLWLDGSPIAPATTYSVTVSSALAAGGDHFAVFADGTAAQDTGKRAVTALADYLAAAEGPLAPPTAQHAVGVGGVRASYVPGGPLALDLTSLALSGVGDPVDPDVQVTLAGRALGTFPVLATGDDASDGRGTAAVRATVPADAPVGPATVTISGPVTGTSVQVPITIVAPTPPAVVKVTPTLRVTVSPKRVLAGRTKARLSVVVRAAGGTPTGTIRVAIGRKTYTGTLSRGTATVRLPKFAKAGTVRATVSYLGDARTVARSASVRITVLRVRPRAGS